MFITSENVEFFAEPADAGDFLGLSRRVQMRLAQMEVQPDDMLLLCEQSPASWNVQNLAGSSALSMIQVKRRLMNQVTGSLEMVALKFPQGRGKVLAGKWNELEPEPVRPAPQPASAEELPAQEDSEYFAESQVPEPLRRPFGQDRSPQPSPSLEDQPEEWPEEVTGIPAEYSYEDENVAQPDDGGVGYPTGDLSEAGADSRDRRPGGGFLFPAARIRQSGKTRWPPRRAASPSVWRKPG